VFLFLFGGAGLARIRRDLVNSAVREFNSYSRDPFARWMLQFLISRLTVIGWIAVILIWAVPERVAGTKRVTLKAQPFLLLL